MSNDTVTIANIKNETEVPAVIVDAQGIIIFVNKCFTDTFGWQAEEIIGDFVSVIIPREMHDAHNLGFSRFVTTGQPKLLNQPLKLSAVNKSGEVFEAEHLIVAEKEKDEWVIGATIRPL
jgi:PAS domain S-box-containing protein